MTSASSKPATMYAIRDILAEVLVGGVHLFKHDAAAVRFFGDVASQKETIVAKHLNDHELIAIGDIDEATGLVTPFADLPRTVITGSAWYLSRAAE